MPGSIVGTHVSKLEALLDMLKSSTADELRLVVEDKLHLVRDGRRIDVGREPLQMRALQALALELLQPDELRVVPRNPRTLSVTRGSDVFEVAIRAPNGALEVVLRRSGGSTAEATGAPAGPVSQRASDPAMPKAAVAGTPQERPSARQPSVRGQIHELIPGDTPPPEPTREEETASNRSVPRGRTDALGSLGPPEPEIALARPPGPPRHTSRTMAAGGGEERFPIDGLLRVMIERKSSDLHLTAGAPPVLRLHGEMEFLHERPLLTSEAIEQLLSPIMPEKVKHEFAQSHDADFPHEITGLSRFRVNAFVDRNGVGAVIRQIPFDIIPAEKLGLSRAVLDMCFLTKGLVLVTGPTGSGKSTTLASMIDHINRNRNDHIITIEDPVEFVHHNKKCLINQREVGPHTASFKRALKAALREDPDVVLVGELRDLETIAIAVETAETGHLVFGTLHTTTAVSTVDRVIDQFPPDRQAQIRVMLSESLKGVVAQILCKKIGGGRVAAMEILLVTPAVASLIRDAKTFQIASVMQTSKAAGMLTMNDSLLGLIQGGLVEPAEAYRKAVDKTGLLMAMKNQGIPFAPHAEK